MANRCLVSGRILLACLFCILLVSSVAFAQNSSQDEKTLTPSQVCETIKGNFDKLLDLHEELLNKLSAGFISPCEAMNTQILHNEILFVLLLKFKNENCSSDQRVKDFFEDYQLIENTLFVLLTPKPEMCLPADAFSRPFYG